MASILQTAFELGLISSLTVLALFLSYTMLLLEQPSVRL